MRLFIAIDFAEMSEYLESLQSKLDNTAAALTLPSRFHLTLKFLGEVQNAEPIIAALRDIRLKAFSLSLDKIGVFPDESCIRVVWVGLNPKEEVIALQKRIDELDFKKEHDFHPHITLARVKYIKDRARFIHSLGMDVEKKTIEVKDFRLVKSNLTGQKPVYEDLAVFPLN